MKSTARLLATAGGIGLLALGLSSYTAYTQDINDISPAALDQIRELLQEKDARTPAQQKLSSQLIYAIKETSGQPVSATIASLQSAASLNAGAGGVLVDIKTLGVGTVQQAIINSGGAVVSSSAAAQSIRARVPLNQMEALAALPEVRSIKPAARAKNNRVAAKPSNFVNLAGRLSANLLIGSVTTQGDITHAANLARSTHGINGSGLRVGVLSDSAEALNFLIGTGDLPVGATNVADIIDGPGSSEGTAMMEIVHDLAPGAQLFFASAFNGPSSFADNIRLLRFTYGCDVIVDDVSYDDESPFQDGEIAQAVNDVTAAGAVYLSSAANSGNLTNNNSNTWEGDFASGGSNALLPGYTLHSFGPQSFNRLLTLTGVVELFWSDPLGASTNDYDLFLLNSAGTAVLPGGASTSIQAGAGDDPFEELFSNAGFPVNARIVIAKKASASARALHLDLFFGEPLQLKTTGSTHGHNGGPATISVAAVAWNSARLGTKPFVGGARNPTESFSSDGPRKMFYLPTGVAISPGNLLFGTNGGTTFSKPDIAAADGVTTRTPGFSPFFGTSAAAPHAAGIATLLKSAKPSATVAEIYDALTSTALDIRAVGIDRDSGYGLVMAPAAVVKIKQ